MRFDDVESYKSSLSRFEYQKQYKLCTLETLESKGRKIVGYGAPAKGNALLNVYGISSKTIEYIVDSTPETIGKFTPGGHIQICETGGSETKTHRLR
jgi:Cys-tRNA synthase (O-phospho-L-seryl-tRNA:Cys-tRNA synthase)